MHFESIRSVVLLALMFTFIMSGCGTESTPVVDAEPAPSNLAIQAPTVTTAPVETAAATQALPPAVALPEPTDASSAVIEAVPTIAEVEPLATESPAVAQPAAESSVTGFVAEGTAVRISDYLHGNNTASGDVYDKDALTAAHKDLPLGTMVRVTNLATEQTVDLLVNDRLPAAAQEVIDVSRAAATALGMPETGAIMVRVELIQ